MTSRCRESMSGPLAPYAPGYRVELRAMGYAKESEPNQLRWMGYLSAWLAERSLDVGAVSDDVVDAFLIARRAAEPSRPIVAARTFAPLLTYLRRLGGVAEPVQAPTNSPLTELLDRYRTYLVRERDLTEGTVDQYLRGAQLFVSDLRAGGPCDFFGLTSAEVTDFLLRECPRRSTSSARDLASRLRSLLRFLYLEGATRVPLAQAIPAAVGWSAGGLPRAIGPEQVRRLLASCDRRRGTGRRDYAILTVLIRLGLRAGEVAALTVDDLDLRAGEMTVRGKGGREDRLPIPIDVGEALVGYLRRGRPQDHGHALFLRAIAPVRNLTSSGVSQVVRAACVRADVPVVGAHRLRHAAATEMLRAGAPLSEIAQVLRHRSEATTAIYAKVDIEALRTLALPWPGGGA